MPFARHATLVANTSTIYTVTGNPSAVEVLNRNGLAEVYVSYDGNAVPPIAVVAGTDMDVIPAAPGAGIIIREIGNREDMVIKVISAAATTISVRGIS